MTNLSFLSGRQLLLWVAVMTVALLRAVRSLLMFQVNYLYEILDSKIDIKFL